MRKIIFHLSTFGFLLKQAFGNYYFRLFFFYVVSKGLIDWWFDAYKESNFGSIPINHYERTEDGKTWMANYTVAEFVYWMGDIIKDFITALAFNRLLKNITIGKLAVRLYFDFIAVDVIFLIISNPYNVNRSKWIAVIFSLVAFFLHTALVTIKNKMIVIPKTSL